MTVIHPVIMCGGAGTRMWPLSRGRSPKQYLPLVGEATLLQETAARARHAGPALAIAPPALICGEGQDDLAAQQLSAAEVELAAILVEPVGRNTAAVAATAALHIAEADPAGLVLLLPADHHIEDPEAYWRSIEAAAAAASEGWLVTLGIEATGPETGYGYIQRGAPLGETVFKVEAFKEKPDRSVAEGYLAAGGYYWNAGIFVFRADAMLSEFERLAPQILSSCCDAYSQAEIGGLVRSLDRAAFEASPAAPVDIAIMERTDKAAVVAPVRAGWDDIGSWAALADLKAALRDAAGAPVIDGDALAIHCKGGLIRSEGPFVAAIGLEDIIVIADGDAVLVVHKDAAQNVKAVVEHLRGHGRKDLL